jgi:hypothetical protein
VSSRFGLDALEKNLVSAENRTTHQLWLGLYRRNIERTKHYIYIYIYIYLIHSLAQHSYRSFRLLVSTHYPDHHHVFPKTNNC